MKYLLDTNTCIKFLKGTSENIRNRVLSAENDISLCSIVKYELYYGAYKSKEVIDNLKKIELFFNKFNTILFNDRCSKICGQIRADLEKNGLPIGPYDLQIASIALSNDLILVTHNIKEFNRISNLRIEDWEI